MHAYLLLLPLCIFLCIEMQRATLIVAEPTFQKLIDLPVQRAGSGWKPCPRSKVQGYYTAVMPMYKQSFIENIV